MGKSVIFLLGSTGYVGSQFLIMLGQAFPHLPVRALVRSLTTEREAWLHQVHPDLTIVEGSLEDEKTLQYQAEDADIVINLASCDHLVTAEGEHLAHAYSDLAQLIV